MITAKHQILVVGGGTAGITVAARLLRKGYLDVGIIEPSRTHYYQPLWTLVGAGQASASSTARPQSWVMPVQASWIKNTAAAIDPDNNTVTCADGASYEYDVLVVCPGIQPRGQVEAVVRRHPAHCPQVTPTATSTSTKHTMAHMRYPNVFSLGDAGSSPNSKTGAAIRKQAPVVVDNIDAFLKNQALRAKYDGYASCPIVTSSHAMPLAEFDYSLQMRPAFPLLDPTKPHRAYWYLKKYGLPWIYWNLMLKGLA